MLASLLRVTASSAGATLRSGKAVWGSSDGRVAVRWAGDGDCAFSAVRPSTAGEEAAAARRKWRRVSAVSP
jgi:hypothetical protein